MSEVGLVVTTLNEQEGLPRWWDGLAQQTRQPDRIVIVDGGSTDGTLGMLSALAEMDPRVTVVSCPGAGISAGRNRAIEELACHAIVAVTDLGTVADPDWLERLVQPLLAGESEVASGFFRPGGTTSMERVIAACTTPTLGEVDADAFLPSSRSVAFLKSAWVSVGGYPEHLEVCEDLVFDLALRGQGARFRFVPGAQVVWTARPTLPSFFRQYRRYARGDARAGRWAVRQRVRYVSYGGGVVALTRVPPVGQG